MGRMSSFTLNCSSAGRRGQHGGIGPSRSPANEAMPHGPRPAWCHSSPGQREQRLSGEVVQSLSKDFISPRRGHTNILHFQNVLSSLSSFFPTPGG